MTAIHTIVTHPGGAHKDDLLACSVLVAENPEAVILRRDPSPTDLADPAVAVVDVGGSHDPARSNFDHHQFPREHAPTCALSLVLDGLGLYQDALRFCDWLETAEWFDSRGPKRTAEWLGAPREAVARLTSPVDMTLLRRFAAAPEHRPGELVHGWMNAVGSDLVEYLRTARAGVERIDRACERWSVEAPDTVVGTVFLAREAVPLDEPSASLGRYVRWKGIAHETGALVYPDRRGDGYGITRYEDDPRLDFSRVGGEEDVRFAHASGFMCKTSATDPKRLRALIALAATAPSS